MEEVKNTELAVLMKFVAKDGTALEFIPTEVIEGTYAFDEDLFINSDTGNIYFHVTEPLMAVDLSTYNNINFFALRTTKEDLKKEFPNLTDEELKEKLLAKALKNIYCIAIPTENSEDYTIIEINKENKTVKEFNDIDMEYYKERFNNTEEDYDDEFEEELEQITIPKTEAPTETLQKKYSFNPHELAEKIKEDVLGQDEAIDKIVQSIWCNYFFMGEEEFNKENILIIGPSGVGKTEIFRRIDALLPNIAVHIADLSSITETGIVGDSLDDIIKSLLIKCIETKNGRQVVNTEKASHSIVVLDEFDKIAMGRNSNNADVGNEPVQQELLKIIEGKEMLIKLNLNGMPQLITINTKNITFVCCGAFEGINKSNSIKEIGFGKDISHNNTEKKYSTITDEDFKKYGFITELVGRIPSIVTLNELPLDILIKIVKKPRRSLFIKKLKILRSVVEEVEVKEDLYEEIAKRAIAKKTGARGLDKVSVDLFSPILSEVTNLSYDYQYAMLNKDTVENPKQYQLKKTKRG